MQKLSIAFSLLYFVSTTFAACVTVDIKNMPQERINLLSATAYRLAFESGVDEAPTVNNGMICFAIFDPKNVITDVTINEKIDAHLATNIDQKNAAIAQEVAKATSSSSARDKLKALGLSDAEIDALK